MVGHILAAQGTQVSLPTFSVSATVAFILGLILGVIIRGKF